MLGRRDELARVREHVGRGLGIIISWSVAELILKVNPGVKYAR